jgi:preprotein translocase subunit SecE
VAQTKSTQSNVSTRRGGSVGAGGRGGSRGTAVAGSGGGPAPVLPVSRGRRTANPFAAIVGFIRDVRSELRKVAWPTSRETVNLTVVVLALSVAMGMFLGGTDYIFQTLFKFLLGLAGGGSA